MKPHILLRYRDCPDAGCFDPDAECWGDPVVDKDSKWEYVRCSKCGFGNIAKKLTKPNAYKPA